MRHAVPRFVWVAVAHCVIDASRIRPRVEHRVRSAPELLCLDARWGDVFTSLERLLHRLEDAYYSRLFEKVGPDEVIPANNPWQHGPNIKIPVDPFNHCWG